MLKLNNRLLAIFLSVLLVSLSGCDERTVTKANDDGDKVTAFKGSWNNKKAN